MINKNKNSQLLKGRYRKDELLGKGGMAITFRGLDLKENRPIVIKEMRQDLKPKQVLRKRFKREITLQETLDHENVIKVFDYELDTNKPFAILEYAEKGNITTLIKDINMSTKINWSIQVLKGMDYIHSKGYVHRDISPENILLNNQNVIKISDFGLCIPFKRSPSIKLTKLGQIGGKEIYMAPEQYEEFDKVDWRADIYSLGIVFYYMLSDGSLPRYTLDDSCDYAFDLIHTYKWIVDRNGTPPLHNRNLRVPPIFDEIILGKMLQYDKNERYITAQQIINSLKPLTDAPIDEIKLFDSLSEDALKCLKMAMIHGGGYPFIWGNRPGEDDYTTGEVPWELEREGFASVKEEEWLTDEGAVTTLYVKLKPKAIKICKWWLCKFRP